MGRKKMRSQNGDIFFYCHVCKVLHRDLSQESGVSESARKGKVFPAVSL